MRNSALFFLINLIIIIILKPILLIFKREMGMFRKHLLCITVLSTTHWLKLAQPAEPIYLTPTLLMGALLATPAKPAVIIGMLKPTQ